MSADTKIADILSHPVRLRILQHVAGREVTTSDLKTALADVKQATLYRHIAALLDAGALSVVSEKRVRGATERTLALGSAARHVDLDELKTVTPQQLRDAFMMFLTHLGQTFDRFADNDSEDLRTRLGFSQTNLYVTERDLEDIHNRLNDLLMPYTQEPADESKHRVTLASILIPDPPGETSDKTVASPDPNADDTD